MAAREHWVISRSNVSNRGYVLSVRELSGRWRSVEGESTKVAWFAEAMSAARQAKFTGDLTVTGNPTAEVLRDPDAVALRQRLTLVVRETPASRDRWAVLTMNDNGELQVSRIVVGSLGVEKLLEEYLTALGDDADDRNVLQLRPGWAASELLATAA